MKNLSLTTLTHTEARRQEFLVKCVESVIANTNVTEVVDWHILINFFDETWEPFINSINTIAESSKFRIHFHKSLKNLGVGGGINYLNNLVRDCKYSLFIEGDWLCIPQKLSLIDKNWLMDSIDYMEKNQEVEVIHLRRYLNDYDHRRFGYGHWIKESNITKEANFRGKNFIHLKQREYTNPPTIRKLEAFYKKNIFPLSEWFDEKGNSLEVKGNEKWGAAEIEKEGLGRELNSVFLSFGNFIHLYDWPHSTRLKDLKNFDITGCKKYNGGCKYGFLTPEKHFCKCCRFEKKFVDLSLHDHYYVQKYLPFIEDGSKSIEEIDDFISGSLYTFDK